jgi:hypothetical protein
MNLVIEHGGVEPNDRGYKSGYPKANKGDRIATVYVSGVRPFDQGDLIGDFAWRREHSAPVAPKVMLALIAPDFYKKHFVKIRKISYDRKAGCNCGCSPGYKVWGEVDMEARVKAGQDYHSEGYIEPRYHHLNYWVSTPEHIQEQKEKMEARTCREAAFGGW